MRGSKVQRYGVCTQQKQQRRSWLSQMHLKAIKTSVKVERSVAEVPALGVC